MRGENAKALADDLATKGTPPHAWGEWESISYATEMYRYTPTCVGRINDMR